MSKPDVCPVCREKAVVVCRCPRRDYSCNNGHDWHVCAVHLVAVAGPSDHAYTTNACTCPSRQPVTK